MANRSNLIQVQVGKPSIIIIHYSNSWHSFSELKFLFWQNRNRIGNRNGKTNRNTNRNGNNRRDEDKKKSRSDKKPFNKQYKLIKRHGFIKLNRTGSGGKMTRNKVIINIVK